MEQDDRSHVLIYEVLGVSKDEGKLIDVYQNKGRFLYKYAGSFLEEAAKLCFKQKFPESGPVRVPNTHGNRPKLFGVDCLVGAMRWKSSGATPRRTATTSRRSTRECRPCAMPVTSRCV